MPSAGQLHRPEPGQPPAFRTQEHSSDSCGVLPLMLFKNLPTGDSAERPSTCRALGELHFPFYLSVVAQTVQASDGATGVAHIPSGSFRLA